MHGLYGMVDKALMEELSNILCVYCTLLMLIDKIDKKFHRALTSLPCLKHPRVL
jgi:predicted membrane protein